MKISLLEYDVSRMGGRQIAFVDGYLSCLKSIGYEVKLYSNFESVLVEKEGLLNYFVSENLTLEDFSFEYKIDGTLEESLIKEWNDSDALLIPYPGLSRIGKKVSCPMICHFIARPKRWWPEHVAQIWTNSKTTKKRLGLDSAHVLYELHDFSRFRETAIPWEERKIDVLEVTAVTKRREGTYVMSNELRDLERLSRRGLKVAGLFLVRTEAERDLVDRLTFEHYMNLPRKYVAGFMGASKIFLHLSPLESCSVAISEALNSGCYPIVREAGSAREQLGDVGLVYDEFSEAEEEIRRVLEEGFEPERSVAQGEKFDRKNHFDTVKGLLGQLS